MLELLAPLAEVIGQGAVIGAHLVSLHSAPDYPCRVDTFGRTVARCEFQNVNPGLYVRLPSGFTAGAYRNSYGQPSAYVGWTFETADRRFALAVGGITGYPGAAIQPAIAPSVRFDLAEQLGQGWAARLTLIPKPPREASAAAVHLSLEAEL